MVVLDATIVNIALPSAQDDARLLRRQPPVDHHRLRARLRQPAAARRPHRRPLRPQARPSSSACSASPSPRRSAAPPRASSVLVGARALQGAFGALLAPAALSLLTTTFTDPTERGKAFGIFGAIAGGGAARRPAARRRAHRVPRLALGHVREPRCSRSPPRSARSPLLRNGAARDRAAHRHPRHAHRVGRPVRARLRLLAAPRPTAGATPLTIALLAAGVVLLVAFVAIERRVDAPAAAAARRRSTATAAARTWPSPSPAPGCSASSCS